MRVYLNLLIFIFITFSLYSGQGSWSKRVPLTSVASDLVSGGGSAFYSIVDPYQSYQDVQDYKKRDGFVFLEYTRKSQTDNQNFLPWRVTVTFKVQNTDNVVEPRTLTINYDNASSTMATLSDYEKIAIPVSANSYNINITSIVAQYYSNGAWLTETNVSPTSTRIPIDIDVRLELRNELMYQLGVESPNLEMLSLNFDPTSFRANWNYIEGAEEYDFEWVFLDRLSNEYQIVTDNINTPSLLQGGGYSLAFDLKESSRVRLKGTHYTIDKTFTTGKLFFRVRPVSKFSDQSNGIYDQVKTGEWSYFSSPSNYLNGTVTLSNLVYYENLYATGFENNKNWLYGIAYAEDGKSVSSVSFYDGGNRGRESLTYNTSDDVTLVSESKFDYEGRATISVIPAPIHGRKLGYQSRFNLDINGGAFEEEDFDIATPGKLSAPATGEKGAAQYFSSNNQFTDDLFRSAIPDANGYVYSQTIYRNDGSGRIESIGGIGEAFQATGTHAVKTYYGTPTEYELQRLFGNNVSDSPEGYRKEMVKDANGQYSVTYYDKRGHVIATGLAGDAPSNLIALENTGVQRVTTPLNSNNNAIDPYTLKSEHTFLSQYPQTIDIDYNVTGAITQLNSQSLYAGMFGGQSITVGNFCTSCRYFVTIEVKDQNGVTINPLNNLGVPTAGAATNIPVYQSALANLCPAPGQPYSYTWNQLPTLHYQLSSIGEYRIIKTLVVDQSSMETTFNGQLSSALAGSNDYQTFLNSYMQTVDYTDCYDNCNDYCVAQWKLDYVNTNGSTAAAAETAWSNLSTSEQTDALQACLDKNCDYQTELSDVDEMLSNNGNSNLCSSLREAMKHQLAPGGEFYTSTIANNPSFQLTSSLTLDYFADPAHQSEWTDAYTEAIVPLHREYCHLTTCEEWSKSLNYSVKLSAKMYETGWVPSNALYTTPYAASMTIDGAAVNQDPFITSVFNGTGTKLQDRVNNYSTYYPNTASVCNSYYPTGTYNLAAYVNGLVNCMINNSNGQINASNELQYKLNAFKGAYDKIKEDLVAEYKLLSLTPCLYYHDGKEIFKGNKNDFNMSLEIENLMQSLNTPDCSDLKAYERTMNWLDCISDECKATIGVMNYVFNSVHVIAGQNGPLTLGEPEYVYQFSLTDLANAYVANTSTTLAELFFAYAKKTCNTNLWGNFYDPGTAGNTAMTGKTEYNSIMTILNNLAASDCGFTLPFACASTSAPVTSVLNNTFSSQVWVTVTDPYPTITEAQLGTAIQNLINVGFTYNNQHTVTSTSGNYGHTEVNYVTTINNFDLGNQMKGDITIYKKRHKYLGVWMQWELLNLEMTIRNVNLCNYTIKMSPITGNTVSVSEVTGATLNSTYLGVLFSEFTGLDLGITLQHASGIPISHNVVVNKTCHAPTTHLELQTIYNPINQTIPDLSSATVIVENDVQDCIDLKNDQAQIDAQWYYNGLMNGIKNKYLSNTKECITKVKDDLRLTYDLKEYQYTLYYYDLAGNLVQTVPPQGVNVLTQAQVDGLTPTSTLPNHSMETRYLYNGLNTLIGQFTPDGGYTGFCLDELYRVRYSQNASQLADHKASYSNYDALGRVVEAGECKAPGYNTLYPDGTMVTTYYNIASLYTYMPASGPLTQDKFDYTVTYYEDVFPNDLSTNTIASKFTNGQENLRNAVGAIAHYQLVDEINKVYAASVISYSYDVHKNVKQMVSTNYQLAKLDEQHKTIEYEYDLISGNVNKVIYQRSKVDEYRHMYHYDANNRLRRAFTSKNGEIWERDAKYFYYLHGALARTELGQDQIQGIDYAYNLQGWLKGVNSTTLDKTRDIGKDGSALSGVAPASDNQYFGVDAYGFNLNYYTGDYTAIGGYTQSKLPFATTSDLVTANGNNGNLYNGNITHMVSAIRKTDESILDILGNVYKYDQLQRIKNVDAYYTANVQLNNSFTGATPYRQGAFKETYSFDKNGNILSLTRNGYGTGVTGGTITNLAMDNFAYKYYNDNSIGAGTNVNPTNGNRLSSVVDDVISTQYTTDIDPGQTTTNYQYNGSGQLVKDVQENIDKIEWTVTGKVKRILYTASAKLAGRKDLEFIYDAMDMRIAKAVYNNDARSDISYTYYSYDAQGNVMATYERNIKPKQLSDLMLYRFEDTYVLNEHYIYGSSRLGIEKHIPKNASYDVLGVSYRGSNVFNVETNLLNGNPVQTYANQNAGIFYSGFDYTNRTVGDKNYELSNHLGNVLSVVTDRKITQTISYQGNFNSTTTDGFTATAGTVSWLANRLSIAGITLNQSVSKVVPTEINQTYRLYYNVDLNAQGGVSAYAKNGATVLATSSSVLTNGQGFLEFTATSINTTIGVTSLGASSRTFFLDDIYVVTKNYSADVVQYTDYSPYGVELDQRNSVGNTYRYGYQGQEGDKEVKNGEGLSWNYKYRMHDPRIGRFFAVDPLAPKYSYNSPYAFSENCVINAVELEGLEKVDVYVYQSKTNTFIKTYTYTDYALGENVNKYVYFNNYGVKSKQVYVGQETKKRYSGADVSTLHEIFDGHSANNEPSTAARKYSDEMVPWDEKMFTGNDDGFNSPGEYEGEKGLVKASAKANTAGCVMQFTPLAPIGTAFCLFSDIVDTRADYLDKDVSAGKATINLGVRLLMTFTGAKTGNLVEKTALSESKKTIINGALNATGEIIENGATSK